MKASLKTFLVLLFLIASAAIYAQFGKASNLDESVSSNSKNTVATINSLKMVVTGTGMVVPNLTVAVKCKASGSIRKLPFDVSDEVKNGDLLLELDPTDEENNVRQAEVSLSAAVARLDQAKQKLAIAVSDQKTHLSQAKVGLKKAQAQAENSDKKSARMVTLLKKNLISQENTDDARFEAVNDACNVNNAKLELESAKLENLSIELTHQDVEIAKNEVESRKIDLSIARQRLQETSIKAPMNGIVSTRDVQIGQIVSSGISNVGGGTTILTIIDLSRIFVQAYIDESSIGKLRVGQKAIISVDAYPDQEFIGSVVRISPEGSNNSNVVTFETKIEVIDQHKNLLKPRMTVSAEILVEERENCLSIPTEAISRKGNQRFVELIDNRGKFSKKEIEVGISDGLMTEVKTGLQKGDQIRIIKSQASSKWQQSKEEQRPPAPPML